MKSFMSLLVLILIPVAFGTREHGAIVGATATDTVVVDFAASSAESWRVVNDGVMGGRSQSDIRDSGRGTAIFSGVVSLENNGGFASVRKTLESIDLSGSTALAVRVLGDGQRYLLRLRTNDRFDGLAYQATFDTAPDEWQVFVIPFSEFLPTFRGRTILDAGPLDSSSIRQISFMIADKQEGPFSLEIAWVRARN